MRTTPVTVLRAAVLAIGILVAAAAPAADGAGSKAQAKTPPAASASAPAQVTAPKHSDYPVRLPQGGQGQHMASSLSTAELAKMRPAYENLKPKVHADR